MNAQELTSKWYEDHAKISEQQKQIDYLTQEVEKLRMIVSDMQIDIEMLQRRGR